MAEETRVYEGMFLIPTGKANKEWDKVLKHLQGLLQKHKAVEKSISKWAERRLAYEVRGQKRGTYVLALFEAGPQRIEALRRDIQLSDIILRSMILAKSPAALEEVEQDAAATQPAAPVAVGGQEKKKPVAEKEESKGGEQ